MSGRLPAVALVPALPVVVTDRRSVARSGPCQNASRQEGRALCRFGHARRSQGGAPRRATRSPTGLSARHVPCTRGGGRLACVRRRERGGSLVQAKPALAGAVDAAFHYREALRRLNDQRAPYLVGGTYAYHAHTRIHRPTKDLDLFVKEADRDRILALLHAGDGRRPSKCPTGWPRPAGTRSSST